VYPATAFAMNSPRSAKKEEGQTHQLTVGLAFFWI
jgi:hypothetical protein